MTRFRKIVAVASLALLAGAAAFGISRYAGAQNSNIVCNQAGCNTLGNQTQTFIQAGIQSFVKTYSYAQLGITPAGSPTDFLTITGSSTRGVHISKITVSGLVSGTGNAIGQLNPQIVRRTAANTGGTFTEPAISTNDSANAGAGAYVSLYSANPTAVGAAAATMAVCRLNLSAATTAGGAPQVCAFNFGVTNDQVVTLRGTSDILALNFGTGATAVPTGATVDVNIEWTEE